MKQAIRFRASFDALKNQLTWRGILVGSMGSVLITMSSLYVALRMGALPWPTIFVVVLSMAILKILRRTNINEINVTHTAMSAGSMVAGGLAFTIPGILMLNPSAQMHVFPLLVVTVSGTVLGIIFTALWRAYFIEREQLPFPMGIAASETLRAGDGGGTRAGILFVALAAATLFTLVRDVSKKIPQIWNWSLPERAGFSAGLWMSPMAIAIGYLIGPLYTGVWFIGALIGYPGIVTAGTWLGWFKNSAAAVEFKNSLGIGLMVGTGVAVLLKQLLPRLRNGLRFRSGKNSPLVFSLQLQGIFFLFLIVVGLLMWGGHLSFWSGVITILGAYVTTVMAAQLTGQTGINPMEIFGILTLLAVKFVTDATPQALFYTAGVVAVACGLTGDVMNDFKSGFLLNTHPTAQLISESVGGVIGAVVSVPVLLALLHTFGTPGPGTALPAPQAYAVASMVGGIPQPAAFAFGLLIGVLLYLPGIPVMTLGIGIYLPLPISITVFVGGVLHWLFRRMGSDSSKNDWGLLVASGTLGGEGITGVLIAMVRFLTMH